VTAFAQLVSRAKAHLDPFKEGTTLSEAQVRLHAADGVDDWELGSNLDAAATFGVDAALHNLGAFKKRLISK
jgi:hypothetical protein